MISQIQGLHHVTSMASDAQSNNAFFTKALGLRRVKKTVNFDAPDVYHLYYGNELGEPGTVMTYFPFPMAARGRAGVGEVGVTGFAVPTGSLDYWKDRFEGLQVQGVAEGMRFGQKELRFVGPDGDRFALIETSHDNRAAFVGAGVPEEAAVRGFHSASMRLRDEGTSAELLKFMGYQEVERQDNISRFVIENGNGANVIDIETLPGAPLAQQGAGSVHHIAFAVEDRAAQLEVRKALMDTGYQVTPVIDRNYFWAVYFRTPGGVLFEVATNEPGFDHDEDSRHLGEVLKLPHQHERLRKQLEQSLQPIKD